MAVRKKHALETRTSTPKHEHWYEDRFLPFFLLFFIYSIYHNPISKQYLWSSLLRATKYCALFLEIGRGSISVQLSIFYTKAWNAWIRHTRDHDSVISFAIIYYTRECRSIFVLSRRRLCSDPMSIQRKKNSSRMLNAKIVSLIYWLGFILLFQYRLKSLCQRFRSMYDRRVLWAICRITLLPTNPFAERRSTEMSLLLRTFGRSSFSRGMNAWRLLNGYKLTKLEGYFNINHSKPPLRSQMVTPEVILPERVLSEADLPEPTLLKASTSRPAVIFWRQLCLCHSKVDIHPRNSTMTEFTGWFWLRYLWYGG